MAVKKIPGRDEIQTYLSVKGFICIKQKNIYKDEDDLILIHPDDLNTLIDHLRQVYDESLTFTPEEDDDDH